MPAPMTTMVWSRSRRPWPRGGFEIADQAVPFADNFPLGKGQSLGLSLVLSVMAEVEVGKTVGGALGGLLVPTK